MLNGCPALVLSSNAILPNRDCRVVSHEASLIHGCFLMIETDQTLVEGLNVGSWSRWIDVDATTCIKRGDACGVLPIEPFRLGRSDPFNLLLKVHVTLL
jgi:hypothetical protein